MYIPEIEELMGISFKDKKLLIEAFTFALSPQESKVINSERMEYLGDGILEMIISNYLFVHFPEKNTGELATMHAMLASRKTAARLMRSLDIAKHIVLPDEQWYLFAEISTSDAALAGIFESIIAALYLDQGYAATQGFVEEFLLIPFDLLHGHKVFKPPFDVKGRLNEKVFARFGVYPVYKLIKRIDRHVENPQFVMGVFIRDQLSGQGIASSKKRAEKHAAWFALRAFESNSN